MSRFEDVCWHEAGHATIAGLHGLSARQTVVRRTVDDDDWVGFNRLTGHPGSMAIVAAAGLPGQLMRLHSDFSKIERSAIQAALAGARDDETQHRVMSERAGSSMAFLETVEKRCWPVLVKNQAKLAAMAAELSENLQIGPLVHAAIMTGVPIQGNWREADRSYLDLLPLPPTTPA